MLPSARVLIVTGSARESSSAHWRVQYERARFASVYSAALPAVGPVHVIAHAGRCGVEVVRVEGGIDLSQALLVRAPNRTASVCFTGESSTLNMK